MTVASLRGPGPLADSIRTIALAVVALLGALVMFVAAVFAAGLLGRRRRRTRCDHDYRRPGSGGEAAPPVDHQETNHA
jgi:hypothetical protein